MKTMETLADALRRLPVLAGLSAEQISWLVEHAQEVRLAPGESTMIEGEPADRLFLVLEGEIHGRREKGPADGRLFLVRSGEVSGMLPFSRMTHWSVTGRAVVPTWLAMVGASLFPEMLRAIPELEARLVGVLADRVRETTRNEQQQEKLMALGKLSAGLAHELNNPAAAVQRSASDLREQLDALRKAAVNLIECGPSAAAMHATLELRQAAARCGATSLEPLAMAERESALDDWLVEHAVERPWELAGIFASSSLELADLDGLAARVPAKVLP
ncbi:MAG: histidine kinase, partial [Acidobacteriota bacterium]|nr:histidine kinase [Acidobacteriota bacterium]